MIRFALIPALVAGPLWAEPAVIADLAVTSGLSSAVAGGPVPSLLEPGEDPHHASLRPSQARALSSADLFVRLGGGLTPWLDDAAASLSGRVLVLDAPEEAEAPDDHDAHEGADHADHDHGPHAWLDPDIAAGWLSDIATVLSEISPEQSDAFHANADAAAAKILAARDAARAALDERAPGPILAVHDAWGAAVEAFGLPVVNAISDGDAERPGVRHLREIEALVAQGDVACLLAAPADDMSQAQRLSTAHDLPIVTLPLTGSAGAEGLDAYLDLIVAIGELGTSCPPRGDAG